MERYALSIDRSIYGWYLTVSSYNGDFVWICVQTRLTAGSSPPSPSPYPGRFLCWPELARLDPYLLAVKCTGINERRARCTSTRYTGPRSHPEGTVWAPSFSPEPFLTGTFLWPTFSPRRRPRRHPLSASWPYKPRKRGKKKKFHLGRCPGARRKQEPAGSDYL